MLKLLNWVVPFIVCIFLIQIVSDVLYVRAMEDASLRGTRRPSGPVHEIESEASANGIVT